MAYIGDVIRFLLPEGGFVCRGAEYEDIEFNAGSAPFTKAEFEAAFATVDKIEADKIAAKEAAKQSAIAKLSALGLTIDEIAAIK